MGFLLYMAVDSTHQCGTGDVLWSLKSSLLRCNHAEYSPILLTHTLSQSVARLPALLHLHINFPPLLFFFPWHSRTVQLLSMNFLSFFMNERLSLTSSVSLWRCMQMNVWMERRRDWQTAPKALSPSLTHKLPSNHRRVGWLMLYTHTHNYTLRQSQYSTWVPLFSSNISCTSELLLKCVINTLLAWLTPVASFLISEKGFDICTNWGNSTDWLDLHN